MTAPRRRAARPPLWPRLAAAMALVVLAVVGVHAARRAARAPAADAPRTEFTVEGLDCPVWCAVRLSDGIDGLDGAAIEAFDQKAGKVVVRHDPERQDVEALRRAFVARGFAVQAAAPAPARR